MTNWPGARRRLPHEPPGEARRVTPWKAVEEPWRGHAGAIMGAMAAGHRGDALNDATNVAHKTGTTLLFINQLRQKIGVTFGNPETTTGGNALKFYASVRMDVRRIGPIKVSEESVGSRTRVRVVKNKMAVPFREAEFDIRWGSGIDVTTDLLDYAIQIGLVEKNGSHLSFSGEQLGQGRERARDTLLRSPVGSTLRAAVDVAAPLHRARRAELAA